jgi:hypothetical protein
MTRRPSKLLQKQIIPQKFKPIQIPTGGVSGSTQNTSNAWVVIVGFPFGFTGTVTENSIKADIQIQTKDGNVFDRFSIAGNDYIAAPASGGTVLVTGIPRKMLVPPSSKIVMTLFPTGSFLLAIECLTLDDALEIL